MADKKVMYNNLNLFSVEGLKDFHQDYEIAQEYLAKKVFG
jgi:hypothetical protein